MHRPKIVEIPYQPHQIFGADGFFGAGPHSQQGELAGNNVLHNVFQIIRGRYPHTAEAFAQYFHGNSFKAIHYTVVPVFD